MSAAVPDQTADPAHIGDQHNNPWAHTHLYPPTHSQLPIGNGEGRTEEASRNRGLLAHAEPCGPIGLTEGGEGGGGAHSRSGVVAATDMALCQEVNTLSGGLLGTEPPRKQDGRSLSLPPHSILHSRPQRSPAKPNTN